MCRPSRVTRRRDGHATIGRNFRRAPAERVQGVGRARLCRCPTWIGFAAESAHAPEHHCLSSRMPRFDSTGRRRVPSPVRWRRVFGGNTFGRRKRWRARDEVVNVIICSSCPVDEPADGGVEGGDSGLDAAGESDRSGMGAGAASEGGGSGLEAGDTALEVGDGHVSDTGACALTELACDGGCLSATDIHNCGACGNECTLLPNVNAAGLACSSGRPCVY
jgi:hypothetical protein